jgi:hypothetical protein
MKHSKTIYSALDEATEKELKEENMCNEKNGYDIALLEKYETCGLNGYEIHSLYRILQFSGVSEVYPIEIEAKEHESTAMGFISAEAAEKCKYDYKTSGLEDFVASIMDDMEKENESGRYVFKGINILLRRIL